MELLEDSLVTKARGRERWRRHSRSRSPPACEALPHIFCGRSRAKRRSNRAVPGHWEGDLIGGSRNSHVATLVERHSRYMKLVKVANKDTESVVSALIKQLQRLPSELYHSLTWDTEVDV